MPFSQVVSRGVGTLFLACNDDWTERNVNGKQGCPKSSDATGTDFMRVGGPGPTNLVLSQNSIKIGLNCIFQHVVYHNNFAKRQFNQNIATYDYLI